MEEVEDKINEPSQNLPKQVEPLDVIKDEKGVNQDPAPEKPEEIKEVKITESPRAEANARPQKIIKSNVAAVKAENKQPKDDIYSTNTRHRSLALLTDRKEISARPSSNYLMNAYKKRRLMNTQNPTKRILRSSRGSKRDLHESQTHANNRQGTKYYI